MKIIGQSLPASWQDSEGIRFFKDIPKSPLLPRNIHESGHLFALGDLDIWPFFFRCNDSALSNSTVVGREHLGSLGREGREN